MLATPTTLIGLLRAVAYGWKQAALAESAAEVFRLGRELHEKLGLMGNRLDKLGRALRSSVNAYNETIATVEGTVLVRARKFRDLKVSDKELPGPSQIDEPVRQIQAPELVDDAVQVEPIVGRGQPSPGTAVLSRERRPGSGRIGPRRSRSAGTGARTRPSPRLRTRRSPPRQLRHELSDASAAPQGDARPP